MANQKQTNQEKQITLPLKKGKKEVYYQVKHKVSRFSAIFGVLPYWKNIINVAAFISSVFVVLILIILLTQFYGKLPNKISLFYYQTSNSWNLIDKEVLIIIPVFASFILVLASRLNTAVFRFDRRLSTVINVAILIFNLFLLIAVLQLFSLILVY